MDRRDQTQATNRASFRTSLPNAHSLTMIAICVTHAHYEDE